MLQTLHASRRDARARLRRALVGSSLVLLALSAHAEPGDEICFPLFRDAGAVPGTAGCPLDAQGAQVGLATKFCTSSIDPANRYCGTLPKDLGKACDRTPNPIAIANGNKSLHAVDYGSAEPGTLGFARHYNSTPSASPGSALGKAWRGSFDARIAPIGGRIAVHRPDGRIVFFAESGGTYTADADVDDRLTRVLSSGEWHFLDASQHTLEVYDANGRLQSVHRAGGGAVSLAYSTASTPTTVAPGPGYLIGASDTTGRSLGFVYDGAGRLTTLQLPAGSIGYGYDGEGRLASVTYPDGFVLGYRYNESAYTDGVSQPQALTGIEEAGVRVAEHFYDAQGRAVVSQKLAAPGQPVSRHALSYAGLQSTVTDALGSQRTYSFSRVLGTLRRTGLSQPAGAGCAASTSAMTYDGRGNVVSSDDFNLNRTCYAYDASRNLETARVEGLPPGTDCTMVFAGALPAGSRRISTEWHPTWRLPVRRAEPGRITTFAYHGQAGANCSAAPALPGNLPVAALCRQTEQATTDATGALAFAAAAQPGVALRQSSFTYNARGQVLVADGPRDDVVDTIVTTYHETTTAQFTRGDIATVTQGPLQTRFEAYDVHGMPLSVKDANEVESVLTYDARQRVKSVTTAGRTTSYDYWPNGLLKLVVPPDGAYLAYYHDGAHRLKTIADRLGNRIDYGLDDAGNRTSEQVRDPALTLRRQVARLVDPLGRVERIIGRE